MFNVVMFEFFVWYYFVFFFMYIDYGYVVGIGVVRVEVIDNQWCIGNGVFVQYVVQGWLVCVGCGMVALAVQFLVVVGYVLVDIIVVWCFGKVQCKVVWNVGKVFYYQWVIWQVIQIVVDYVQCGIDFVDMYFQMGNNVVVLFVVDFYWQQVIVDKWVIGVGIVGVIVGVDYWVNVIEVVSDFWVQMINVDSVLFYVWCIQQYIYQFLYFMMYLLCQLMGLDYVIFQQIVMNFVDQVQVVGFMCIGKDFCYFYGGFMYVEELYKVGVEVGKVVGEVEVEQM